MNNNTSHLSNSNSGSDDESDRHRDPDFYRRPTRVLPRTYPLRSRLNIQGRNFEVGSSSSTRTEIKPRSETTPLYGVRTKKIIINGDNGGRDAMSRTSLITWLKENNVLAENTKVFCVYESLVGWVCKGGILCACCNGIHTPIKFIMHNMLKGVQRRPYENIFVAETRIPLISLLENVLKSMGMFGLNGPLENGPVQPNIEGDDDICLLCADGGDLMCCDICNSTYHHKCFGLTVVPRGDWLCPYCICKFCRCGPSIENPVNVKCFHCGKKFHELCYEWPTQLFLYSWGRTLCDDNCMKIYLTLRRLEGEQQELGEGFTWTLLRRMDEGAGVGLIGCKYQFIENHAKLAFAKDLMRECFEPVIDRLTGMDIIENVMYNCGSNCNRINFRGFYTVILEKDEEIISIASLRIHGKLFAELPFIATCEKTRGRGYCRRLLSVIESLLCSLEVPNLVLPSTIESHTSWEDKYGFKVANGAITQILMDWNTLTFHNSVMLHKVPSPNQGRGRFEREVLNLNEDPQENN